MGLVRTSITALLFVAAGSPSVRAQAGDPPVEARTGALQPPWSTVIHMQGSHDGEPSFHLTLEAKGVILNDGRNAIVGLRPGGSLTITHAILSGYPDPDPLRRVGSNDTVVRTLRVTSGQDHQLQYAYGVNGSTLEFGEEGRLWLDRILRKYNGR